MEPSGGDGEVAAKRARPSSDDAGGDGEDRISALPDDVLVLILLRLHTWAAAQTSVLSRRWRRVWALLPVLRFYLVQDPSLIRPALETHEVPLQYLFVSTLDAGPDPAAAWLPAAAARCICGHFVFHNLVPGVDAQEDREEEATQRGALALPCLESATTASLDLGFLGLAVPPAGVFSRLTELSLTRVRIHGPVELGNAVSSPRCPCLQKLTVRHVRGLENLVIHSDSLQKVELFDLRGLRQLTIVASALKDLEVTNCFFYSRKQPVASISAPQLLTLVWNDLYDPGSVHLDSWPDNHACLSLLQHFKVIQSLILALNYMWEMNNYQYMMEDMTMLPDIMFLKLIVLANGHAFGASAFHVLRMCSRIRTLMLELSLLARTDMKAQTTCPSGCICSDQHNWKTEQLLLNHLKEVEISELRGSEHEVTFVKHLFKWATVLGKVSVTFDYSVTESIVKELCQVLRSFSRPEIRMEFYMYKNTIKVPYAPED